MSFESGQPQNNNSNRNTWKYILFILLLALLFASNPSLQDHRDAVSAKVNRLLGQEIAERDTTENTLDHAGAQLGQMLGTMIINKVVENTVQRKNYLFFSLTNFESGGDEKIIGFGILGNVFITNRVDQKFNEARDKMQNE